MTSSATPLPTGATFELIATYELDYLRDIATKELDKFLTGSEVKSDLVGKMEEKPKYRVKLYRVVYRSVVPEHANSPTLASGLVAIPDTDATTLPVVSYQHGTVFDRNSVPSNPVDSDETRLVLAQFAAQGYVVVGADYFGRGISDLPDSYLVKDSTRQAGYDMLATARDFLTAQGIAVSHVFLSGWSQGGWVTMQYLHMLEGHGIKVDACAVASAPVDIYLTVNRWMNNPQEVDAEYLPGVVALHLQAQEYYLRQHGLTEAAIKAKYVEAARALYTGATDWTTFRKNTVAGLQDFLNEDFRLGGYAGESPYWQTLQQNQAYRWRAVTPTRTYFGGRDEVTPTYIGHLMESTQSFLGGAPAASIDAGARANHRGIFIYGLIDQKVWFDQIRGQSN